MKRLKDNFNKNDWLASISPRWLNTIAKFYNDLTMMHGDVIHCTDGKVILNPFALSGGGSSGSQGSFSIKSIDGDTATMRGGRIRWSGRGSFDLTDGTEVTVTGGTADSPQYILLQMSKDAGPSDATIVCTSTDLDDDGTYLYRTLHEVYLDGTKVRYVKDRRGDWNLGSPI